MSMQLPDITTIMIGFVLGGWITGPVGLIWVMITNRWHALLMLASPFLTIVYAIIANHAIHHDGKSFRMASNDAGMAINIFLVIQLILIGSIIAICYRRGIYPAIILGHCSAALALFQGFVMSMALTGNWL